MSNYWSERMAKAQAKAFNKTRLAIDRRMRKYYKQLAQQTINDFEATYLKILEAQAADIPPTPADLYKLDKYWSMQSQLRHRLEKLGEKQISSLTYLFEYNYKEVYNSLAIKGLTAYRTLDDDAIKQVINQIWCTDGKSWSQRIWENVNLLKETLEEGLIHCVTTGKKTTQLKNILQERFNVSYGRADALVRTELAHIQTQAAQQRYRDYGLEQMEVWVDEDERTCKICAKHEGEIYSVNDKMPVPFHPRCRCCMIPVIKKPPDTV